MNEIVIKTTLNIQFIKDNYDELIQQQLFQKCIKDIGYIIEILNYKQYGDKIISSFSNNVLLKFIVNVSVFLPEVEKNIETKVIKKIVNCAIAQYKNFIPFFITKGFAYCEVNDIVTIKILSTKFNNGKYISLCELIKINENNVF